MARTAAPNRYPEESRDRNCVLRAGASRLRANQKRCDHERALGIAEVNPCCFIPNHIQGFAAFDFSGVTEAQVKFTQDFLFLKVGHVKGDSISGLAGGLPVVPGAGMVNRIKGGGG